MNSPVTAENLALSSGALAGTADLSVTRSLAWTGGSMTGSGRTVIAPTGNLSISSTSIHDLTRTLENNGSALWSGGDLRFNNATFQNNGTMSTFSPAAGLFCYAVDDFGLTTNVFNNLGTFTSIGGNATMFRTGVVFNSNGTVDGKLGFIQLYAGGDYGPQATFAGNVTLGKNSTTSTHVFDSTVNVTGTLTLVTPITIDAPVVFSGPGNVLLSTTLSGAADVTFNTTLNWGTGVMSGAGKTIIAPGGALNFNGGGFVDLNRTLQNNGTTVWSAGSLRMSGGTFQNNGSFQVIIVPAISGLPNLMANGGVNAFNNAGSFTNSAPSSSNSLTIGVPFNNSGVLNGLSGGILLNGGGAASGPATVFAGSVTMGSGTFSIGGAATVLGALTVSTPLTLTSATTFSGPGSVTLALGILGNPNATFGTTLNWTGGGMAGTGKTTITADGALNLSGSTHNLGRTLQNDGATLWTSGDLTMTGGTFLNNGTFQSNTTSTLSSVGSSGSGSFSNAGAFIHQRGTTRFTTLSGSSVAFNNSGSVTVTAGVLELNAGGTSTGSFVMEAGASLSFTGSSSLYSSGAGTTFDGGGVVNVSGATFSVDAATSIPNLTLTSGTIAGAANLTVPRTMSWTGGAMSGAGATIITPTATLTINTISGVQLSRELRNNGLAAWLTGNLQMVGGTFQNNGTFEAAPLTQSGLKSTSGGGVNAFNNAGLFITSSAGTTQFAVPFNNLGTISGPAIPIASLVLAGGGVHGPLATFGGTISLTGGAHTFAATAKVDGELQVNTPISFDTVSTFSGIGDVRLTSDLSGAADVTFNTMVIWTGGTMSGAGKTIIGPSGALMISYNSHTLSRTLQNDGLVTWLGGNIVLTDGAFQNNGLFQTLAFDQPLTMSPFGGVNLFTNAGQFVHMASGSTPQFNPVNIAIPFNNNGTVDGRYGTINLTAGGAHGPQAIFAGTVNLSGTHTFGAITTVPGTLTLSNLVNFDSPALFTGPGSVTLTSDISGSADVTFENALIWKGGTMHEGGKTIIAPSGSLNINQSGPTPIRLDRTLVNNGVTTWTGGALNMSGIGGASVFQNNGSFVAIGTSLVATGFGNFNNAGQFTAQNASNVEFAMANGFRVLFNNSGTLEGKGNPIQLSAGGTHAATAIFKGNVKLGGGTHIFDSTVTVTGALLITTPLTIDSPVSFSGPGSVELSASLDGAADVTFHTSLVWSRGAMSGTGKTIIASDGSLLLSTPSDAPHTTHDLNRLLQNDGATTWTAGDLNLSDATFQNNGLFTTRQSIISFQLNINGVAGSNAFNNVGQILILGSVTISFEPTAAGVKFNNSGIADAGTGAGNLAIRAGGANGNGGTFGGNVIVLNNPFSFGATTNVTGTLTMSLPWNITEVLAFNGPGRLSLRSPTALTGGGAFTGNATINLGNTISSDAPIVFTQPVVISSTGTINSPASFSNLSLSGTLAGSGDVTVIGQLAWTGGQMNGAGATIVSPGASLLISGASHALNRSLRTDGATTWTSGPIISTAGWRNNGSFTASLTYTPMGQLLGQFGGDSASFINVGSFVSVGPGIVQTFGVLDNQGVIDIENGTTEINGTFSGSGQFFGAQPGTVSMRTDLKSTSTNPQQFNGFGVLQFSAPFSQPVLSLEAHSQDLGNTAAGFANNFAIPTLYVSYYLGLPITTVRLVDQSENAPGAAPEAVYVDKLILDSQTTLDLNGLHLYARSITGAGNIIGGQVTLLLPEVTQVLAAGTGWSPAFYGQLQTANLGDGGYVIPGNAADQLAPLPWRNIDQIKIVFNEDVNVQADSLTVTSGALGAIVPVDFDYDVTSHIATWTLAQPIGNDTLTLSLASTGPAAVKDSSGAALDGEWPSTTGDYPSGNGAAGGDFDFAFNVLPGDVTQDGVVDIQDITRAANHWLQASPADDSNGDGVVDIQEMTLIANHWLETNSGGGGGGQASVLTTPNDDVVNALLGSTTGGGAVAETIVSPSASLTSTVFWDGGGDGASWSDPLNWSGNVLPGVNDDVTIDAPGEVTVTYTLNSRTVHTLTVGADDQLTITGGAGLVVTATSSINGTLAVSGIVTLKGDSTVATLNFSGGTIDGAGTITITNGMSWSSGQFDGTGIVFIDQSATLTISANALNTPHTLNKRTLQNDGITTWTSGVLGFTNSATFVNNGDFYASPASPSTLIANGTGHFINSGLFKNVGTGQVTVGAGQSTVKFDNLGELDGGIGGIALNSGGDVGSGSSFANVTLAGQGMNFVVTTAGATVHLAGDLKVQYSNIVVNANTTFKGPGTLSLLGFVKGAGDVTFESNVLWLGGGMSGSGKTIIPYGAAFILQCGKSISLLNSPIASLERTLENYGVITWTTGLLFVVHGTLDNRGEITIHDGVGGYSVDTGNTLVNYGTITFEGNQTIEFGNFTGPGLTINNIGSIFLAGPAINFASPTQFNNLGSIDIQLGSLSLNGNLTTSENGSLSGSAVGALSIQGNLLGDSTNADLIGALATVTFNGPGTAAAPQLLEASSHDVGNVATGFSHNFAFNTLSLAGTTYVKLVDQSDNATGPDPEAVYVDTLIVPAGTTLDLNGLHLYARATQIAGTILGGAVTIVPPAVSGVLLASSAWTPEFFAQLDAAGLGEGGYAIAGDAPEQVESLPWQNVDQIKIAFNEDVIVQADSLAITSAALGAIVPTDFSYDVGAHVATWTLAQPISNDAIALSLAASGPAAVTDRHGVALDGEWPSNAAGFPSGNGDAGGDFQIDFSLLAGDLTHDGVVDIQDITFAANNWLQASPTADGNGDGVVDIQDITLIANNWLATHSGAGGGGGKRA